MTDKRKQTAKSEYKYALIYCRVSSQQQVTDGHGLDSQEQRCVQYAARFNLKVIKIFRDEGVSGGLGLFDRPAMQELINFLDAHPTENFAVVFDDISRFARDVKVHIQLRSELVSRGAKLFCLNFNFDDSPEGEFAEMITAASAQYARQSNRRTVIQKQRARLDSGYWPFARPPGLTFVKSPLGGKILAPDEPLASIYKQAIEKYRDFKLNTLQEVQTFILHEYEAHGITRKLSLHGVTSILTEPLYCGYLECKKWGVPLKPGQHKGFISFETFQAVQEKLAKTAKNRLRKDYRPDFPLRNFALCYLCGKPMTACWHRGRNKNKPYNHYWCKTKGCPMKNKAVPGVVMHRRFEKLLKEMTPDKPVIDLAKAILIDTWQTRKQKEGEVRLSLAKKITAIQNRIEAYIARIPNATNEGLIAQYEAEIDKLAKQKSALEADLNKKSYLENEFGTAAGVVFDYLKRPINQWKNPNYRTKRLLLSMYFDRGIPYDRVSGFGTPVLPLIIERISQKQVSKSNLVELTGIAPVSTRLKHPRLQA